METKTKESRIEKLLEKVGRPYKMKNRDGTYQGCFYPIQFLYKKLPRYEMPETGIREACKFALQKIEENCKKIHPSELQAGDIITTNLKGVLHAAIYLKYGKIIHVFKDDTLQIGRLKTFNDFQSFRVA